MNDTVAVKYFADKPAIVIPFNEARETYETLNALELTDPKDTQLLVALISAMGVQSKKKLETPAGQPSFAERKLAEWEGKYPELQSGQK